MAVFRYEGEPSRPGITHGDCLEIRVPEKGPGGGKRNKRSYKPQGGKTKFTPGQDTIVVTDARSIRVLEADSRFTRIS